MPYIKQAAQVALGVLNSTHHTLLAGEAATRFAESLGYQRTNLSTNESLESWNQWKKGYCQPNFRISYAWTPDPKQNCGPYHYKNGSRSGENSGLQFKDIDGSSFTFLEGQSLSDCPKGSYRFLINNSHKSEKKY